MALVEAAYLSAARFRSIGLDEIKMENPVRQKEAPKESPGLFGKLFSTSRTREIELNKILGKLTPRAQRVLTLAKEEAARLNHNFVGTEHLLLGLIKLGQGTAINVIRKAGLELEAVRTAVEKYVGVGPDQKVIGHIPPTPRVKKALTLAGKEARGLNHTCVGTEHILLGLLREGDGVAARVLKNLNVEVEKPARKS